MMDIKNSKYFYRIYCDDNAGVLLLNRLTREHLILTLFWRSCD